LRLTKVKETINRKISGYTLDDGIAKLKLQLK